MTSNNDNAWGDIPSSSELFGGEFFGDELMEMYANSNGDDDDDDNVVISLLGEDGNVSPNRIQTRSSTNINNNANAQEDEVNDGMLVAMNAAAMDGGFTGFDSPSDFLPNDVSSSQVAVNSRQSAASSAGVSSSASSTKRTVLASTNYSAQAPPAKKHKAAVAAASTAAAPASVTVANRSYLAAASSTKAVAPTDPPARIVSTTSTTLATASKIAKGAAPGSVGVLPSNVIPAAGRVVAAATSATATQPASVRVQLRAGGGVAHQVVPRPPVIPTSTAAAAAVNRRPGAGAPTLTAAARAAGMIPKATMSKVTDLGLGGPKRAATEADFKNVACAAVSSLIQNANGVAKTVKCPGIKADKVDTSTAHINALTSQNWVTACNPVPQAADISSNASNCDKAARNARRATLSQEERAKQNRDRNREHARNTRLRKKAYVEELKRTLTEIVSQRDAADVEKRHAAQREREQREVRFRVMEEFLKLRGRNELNVARWVAILEDGFIFTLPKTPYRQMVDGEKSPVNSRGGDDANNSSSRSDLEQVLRGSGPVMEDSKYLSNFLQAVGGDSSSYASNASSSQIQIVYRCDRKRFFMDGNITFMDFAATTIGAVNKGLPSEIVFKGSMRSSFSPASNKLISVDITFDTGAITSQLERLGVSIEAPDAAAAQAAAHEADALLDSLQMPQVAFVDKKNGVGPASVSSDDGEQSLPA
jgi:hypothetical protein